MAMRDVMLNTMVGIQIVKYIVTGEEKSGKVVPCTYVHAIIKPQHLERTMTQRATYNTQ